MLMTAGVLVFMVAFIKVCSVHTPSSNPRKPPALKISDTLRRPIKHVRIEELFIFVLLFLRSFRAIVNA